jgi:hypothetical protein
MPRENCACKAIAVRFILRQQYLPRETAFAKMQAMVQGAEILRAEYQ